MRQRERERETVRILTPPRRRCHREDLRQAGGYPVTHEGPRSVRPGLKKRSGWYRLKPLKCDHPQGRQQKPKLL